MTDLAGTPSPGLAAAQWVLGSLASERVPWWAAQWLVDGYDGEALRQLAGLGDGDARAVWDLLPRALAEMSVQIPHSMAAAAMVSFDHFARLCLSGTASERWVAQKVEETVALSDHDPAVMDLPLGQLYGLEDAWAGGWGSPEEDVRRQVRAACARQVNEGQGSPGAAVRPAG